MERQPHHEEAPQSSSRFEADHLVMSEAEAVGHFGSWAWDVNSDRLWWSQGTYRIFGLDSARFKPSYQEYLAHVHPADREFVDQSVRASLDEGRPYHLFHRILRPDGSMRWLRAQGEVIRSAGQVRMVGTGVDVTEMRLAQEESSRLADIVNASPDAILSFTLDGVITSWNPGAEALYKRKRADAVGSSIAELFVTGQSPDHTWLLAALRSGGPVHGIDASQRSSSGHVFQASLTASAIADQYGVTGGSMIVRDVTPARAMERALREREAEYRRMAETAQEGVWVIDTKNSTLFANDAMGAILGLKREDMLGRSMFDFMDESARALAEKNVQRRKHGIAERHPFVLRRNDGSRVVTEMAASPILDAGGQYLGALAMVTDVSERVRHERELAGLIVTLENERNWFRATIENSTAGILLVKAANPEVVNSNPRAVEMFGFAPGWVRMASEFQGRLCEKDGSPVAAIPLRDRVLNGECIVGREYLIKRADGTAVAVLMSAGPVFSNAGKLLGAVGVFDDVTELKRLQSLREEWTSIVAHDLRQPLSTLLMRAEMLAERVARGSTEGFEAGLESMAVSARQLARLVNDLTDASLLESNRFKLQKQPADPAALLRDVAARSAAVAERHPIELDLPAHTTPIAMDSQRIEQVLVNLVENADKYGYPGAPIRFRLRQTNERVRIDVINEGDGIPSEEVATVFDRYRRTHAAETGRRTGLGLGLYIAKGIVESHGGRIAVESIPKTVTTFTFELPAG